MAFPVVAWLAMLFALSVPVKPAAAPQDAPRIRPHTQRVIPAHKHIPEPPPYPPITSYS